MNCPGDNFLSYLYFTLRDRKTEKITQKLPSRSGVILGFESCFPRVNYLTQHNSPLGKKLRAYLDQSALLSKLYYGHTTSILRNTNSDISGGRFLPDTTLWENTTNVKRLRLPALRSSLLRKGDLCCRPADRKVRVFQ